MTKNFYTVTKEINGTTYVAQFNGISAALRGVDESYIDGTSNISLDKLSKYLFEHVIVKPTGLTADDFESLEEFTEVVNFARSVMQGDFRDKKDEKSTKAASKE